MHCYSISKVKLQNYLLVWEISLYEIPFQLNNDETKIILLSAVLGGQWLPSPFFATRCFPSWHFVVINFSPFISGRIRGIINLILDNIFLLNLSQKSPENCWVNSHDLFISENNCKNIKTLPLIIAINLFVFHFYSQINIQYLRLKVTSKLEEKFSENSGYSSKTSNRSSRIILCKSQYVKARTLQEDFPIVS